MPDHRRTLVLRTTGYGSACEIAEFYYVLLSCQTKRGENNFTSFKKAQTSFKKAQTSYKKAQTSLFCCSLFLSSGRHFSPEILVTLSYETFVWSPRNISLYFLFFGFANVRFKTSLVSGRTKAF
jgi:hypothetical protein